MEPSRREVIQSSFVALTSEDDTAGLIRRVQELAEEIRRLAETNPPVGAVLAYLGSWPAPGEERDRRESRLGWLLCDGRTFDARRYPELARILGGNHLPNFSGRVARGTGQNERPAATGGRDHQPAENFSTGPAGGHAHGLPAFTGGIGRISNELANQIGNCRYSIKDDQAGWRANEGGNAHHIDVSGGANNEGQHAHDLGGNTAGVSDHNHPLPRLELIPSYVAVNYIIKATSCRHTTA